MTEKISVQFSLEIKYLTPYEKSRFILLFEKYRRLIVCYTTWFEHERFGRESGYFVVTFKDEELTISENEINFISKQN